MNLFYLAKTAKGCADQHCDKHLFKMIPETAQMLCTAKAVADYGGLQVPREDVTTEDGRVPEKTYRVTHKHHPCVVAILKSRACWRFAADVGIHLCERYTPEFGGKVHASETLIRGLRHVGLACPRPDRKFKQGTVTAIVQGDDLEPFEIPLCMPADCLVPAAAGNGFDACESYRTYYVRDKASFATWKRSSPPAWWPFGLESSREHAVPKTNRGTSKISTWRAKRERIKKLRKVLTTPQVRTDLAACRAQAEQPL